MIKSQISVIKGQWNVALQTVINIV